LFNCQGKIKENKRLFCRVKLVSRQKNAKIHLRKRFIPNRNPACLSHLAKDLVPENDREHFLKIAKEEIAALHEGNYARYRLRPGEFKDWQKQKT
jgi:hypothetical protein